MKIVELSSFADADDLASAVARAWLDEIESANRAGKPHCVALSGGRIMQRFFTATVEQAKNRQVAFTNVHFFWADERCVPPADPDSNFKLAKELLLLRLNIAAEKIHRLRGEDSPADALSQAEAELGRTAPKNQNHRPVLDLVLLSMGEDGHIASLFPNADPTALNSPASFLAVKNSPKPPPGRISLSYAAIADAQHVWSMVSGAGKEAAFRESIKPAGQTPLARVIQSRPAQSPVKVFTDLAGF
ncbi:MAG: 6-phosphogluconolactonase [Verrucomicrobiota bacterium]